MRPTLLRPPVFRFATVSFASGLRFVISEKSESTVKRNDEVNGLKVLSPINRYANSILSPSLRVTTAFFQLAVRPNCTVRSRRALPRTFIVFT